MLVQILVLFITHVVIPVSLVVSLWRRPEASRSGWLLRVLYTGAFLLFLFVAGRWDWPGYYLRYVFVALFVAATVASSRAAGALRSADATSGGSWRQHAGGLLSLAVFIGFLLWAGRGYVYTDTPVHLAFPLRDGPYYVAQGGNSVLVNYHNASSTQRYALDIVKLNVLGVRASGVYPTTLEQYAIFGATVHSPCEGAITAAVDGLVDLIPPAADRDNVAGNHVVIACGGVHVVLAHLQTGSVLVASGDAVTTGQPLGRVGNTGNTSEPHLHMHAFRARAEEPMEGEGVPILFDGRFPVRNQIF